MKILNNFKRIYNFKKYKKTRKKKKKNKKSKYFNNKSLNY